MIHELIYEDEYNCFETQWQYGINPFSKLPLYLVDTWVSCGTYHDGTYFTITSDYPIDIPCIFMPKGIFKSQDGWSILAHENAHHWHQGNKTSSNTISTWTLFESEIWMNVFLRYETKYALQQLHIQHVAQVDKIHQDQYIQYEQEQIAMYRQRRGTAWHEIADDIEADLQQLLIVQHTP